MPLQEPARRDDHRVSIELTRLLFGQAGFVLAATSVNALLLVLAAWGRIAAPLLLAWLGSVLLLSFWRLHIMRAYRRQDGVNAATTRQQQYIRSALFSGLLWGLGGCLLALTHDLALQALATLVLGGMVVGATITYAANLAAFFAYVLPSLVPLVPLFVLEGGRLHWVMVALIVSFLSVITRAAFRSHQSLRRSIALGMANSELVEELTASHARMEESEALFRTLAETTATGIFAYRENFVYVNPAGEAMSGYSADELLHRPFWTIVHPDHLEMARSRGQQRLRGEATPSHYEFKVLTKDGRTRWVELHAGVVNFNGLPTNLGTTFDITDRKVAEESLFLEKELAQITLRAIGDAVATTDRAGCIESLNPAAVRLLHLPEAEAYGQPFATAFRLLELDGTTAHDPVGLCLFGQEVVRPGEPLLLVNDDSTHTVELVATPLLDHEGDVLGTVVVFHDVSVLHDLGQEMRYHASHDTLTGLVNRREVMVRLEHLLESAHLEGAEHALCYLDLDQFKVVNDSCGHMAGDELLKQITAELRKAIREGDTLGRLGGDEFALLLAYCPIDKAVGLAERMRSALGDYRFSWEGRGFEVGASIGVVPITAVSEDVNDLLRAADAACYVAKEEGRNRVHLYQPDDLAVAEHQSRLAWVARIHQGIQEDRFTLYGQRIQRLGNPDVGTHLEVLLRLMDSDGSPIPPGAFLPTAERYRLMPELDRWVVRRALADLAPLLRAGQTECAINLSGQSLADAGLLELILAEIARHGIPPAAVCMEITETSAISHLASAIEFARGLKAAGCKLALDDFGSGLSSFSYLKQLPVDYLKIDGSFVRGMDTDPIDRAIVQSIVYVAANMDKATIAECVENATVLQHLIELGVDFGQGYHLERPRPLRDWIES